MTHLTCIPKPPLSQFVDFIWVGKADKLNLQTENHAPLFTELIFNYGGKFLMKGENILNDSSKHGDYMISGLKTAPFQTLVSGTYRTVGLILKPFCYGMLINTIGTQRMNTISNVLFEYLIESSIPNFDVIEDHLLKLFEGNRIDPDLIRFENQISAQLLQKGALKDFNLSLSISQKSFIQKFKKNYLLTPGQYVKLKQVNYAAKMLKNPNSENLTHIGLNAGFYDQSHFIRTFKRFCGMTPGRFSKFGLSY